MPPAWALRYAQPLDSFRLPKERAAQLALGQTIGLDGWTLLSRVYAPDAPDWLRRVPAVETLRQALRARAG